MFISKFITKDVVTLCRKSDIAEAKKLMIHYRIRHLPVTRPDSTLIGIVSDRDIRSAMPSKYFHKHGIKEMERIIHALITENITFGSILVYRDWNPGKRAVFPYLLTKNVVNLKKKLRNMGYDILDPVEW